MDKLEHIPLSLAVQRLMFGLLENGDPSKNNIFLDSQERLFAYYDDACDALLERMVIKKDNVLRYLNRKYIPKFNETGAIFENQKCIQKVVINPDKSLFIHIAKSEPHKIITDTLHVMRLLKDRGFEFDQKIEFQIDQVQMVRQDIMLYNQLVRDIGLVPPAAFIREANILLEKYPDLETIAWIKKRTIKRKFLRYYVRLGKINWKQLRQIMNIVDFTDDNIKAVCNDIRTQNEGLNGKTLKVI